MGPVFIDEPSSRTHFSNTTGAVITCTATSSIPPVKIWWVLADGQTPVTDVAGLRYVRPNGQLVFPPFPIGQYRQDIHSTVWSTSIITIDLTFYFPFFLLLLASFRHIDVWQVTVLVRFEVATVKFVLVSCYFQLLYSILVVHSIVMHVDLYQFKIIASFQFNMCLLTLIH